MSDSALNQFVSQGTTTQRLAQTPTPPTPASGSPLGYFCWDRTLQQMFAYDTNSAAWVAVASVAGTGVTGTGLTSGLVVVGAGGSAITVAANSIPLFRTTLTLTDAQIKALPTTPVTVITAQGSGFWIKVLGVTYQSHVQTTAYTNFDATYTDLHLVITGGYYASYGPVNDATTTPALVEIHDILAVLNDSIIEVGQPSQSAIGASATTAGYVTQTNFIGSSAVDNQPLQVAMDNNGTGNLTGGSGGNTLKVTVYWSKEAL